MNTVAAVFGQMPNIGSSDDQGMPGIFGLFFAIFIIAVIASITVAVVRFSRTRQMAMDKGASDAEATAIALSGNIGTAAAYVKPAPSHSAAARIAEVRDLEARGLITTEQAATRVEEILRGI